MRLHQFINVLPQSALGVWLTDQTRIYSQFPQRTARTAKDLLFGETVLGETPPPRKVSVRDGGSLLPGCLTGAGVWGGGDSSRAVSLASRIRGRRRPRKNQFFSCVSFCLSGMMDLLKYFSNLRKQGSFWDAQKIPLGSRREADTEATVLGLGGAWGCGLCVTCPSLGILWPASSAPLTSSMVGFRVTCR